MHHYKLPQKNFLLVCSEPCVVFTWSVSQWSWQKSSERCILIFQQTNACGVFLHLFVSGQKPKRAAVLAANN